MKALDRKLLRDLARARGQVITTALVVAGGMAAYITLMGTYGALRDAQAAYYEANGFPQVFATLRRAPDAELERLRAVPDVAQAQTRLAFDGRFDLPGLAEPAAGRLLSLPPEGETALPAVTMVSGRLPEPGRRDEALLLESFALSNGLSPGDRVPAIVEGRRLDLEITGLAISPEYVMPVGVGGFYTPRRYGVAWLRRDALAAATGMEGAWNEITFRLRPGAVEEEVIAAVDEELAPWGGFGAYGRREQASHRALDGELQQLETLALRVPLIFLLVEAFLLNVILGRFVRAQREQIAALKALGYRNGQLASHYLTFALLIVVLGCGAGIGLGIWGGAWFVSIYKHFFRLPVLEIDLDAALLVPAVATSAIAALAGALGSVRAAVRMAPAEAMRPPSPSSYRRGVLTRLGLARLFTQTGRIVVRELERRPVRALLSTLGIAMGVAILVVGRFQYDAIRWYVDTALVRGLGADAIVGLSRPVAAGTALELARLPGVLEVEVGRDVPARITLGHRQRRAVLQAVPEGASLRRIMQMDGARATVPAGGVALSWALAQALHAGPGDHVTALRLEGDRAELDLPVVAVIDDLGGLTAYVDARHLHTLLGEERAATTAYLAIDPGRIDEATAALRRSPLVTVVITKRSILDSFEATTASYSGAMTVIIVFFGSVLAVGIIYNNARISLAERGRDLATLRVIGMTRDEVSTVLLGELGVQLVLAIPPGMLLGNLLSRAIMASVDPELYRFPVVIYPRTYAFAVLTVIGAGLVSALLARRKLDRLDITAALKARD